MTTMTKPQATQAWCPMVRTVRWEQDAPSSDESRAIGGCNSGGKSARSPMNARCIADACAMWRWSAFPRERCLDGPETIEDYNETLRRGYCGLAGRPEVIK